MADATRSKTTVRLLSGNCLRMTAASAMEHGEAVVKNSSAASTTGHAPAALADQDAQATADFIGFVVDHAPNEGGDYDVASGETIDVSQDGAIVRGWTDLTPGTVYFLSGNPGEICPYSDLITGDWVTQVGVGWSATDLLQKTGTLPVAAKA